MTGDLHQLTGAYVLDSLDDVERRAFERHMADCDDCRTEVRELSETVAELGLSAATAPPEALRDSVMAEVSRTVQLAPHLRTAPASQTTRRWASFLAVAAVAVLAFGLGAFVTQQRSAPAPLAQEQIDAIVAAKDSQLARMPLPGDARSTVIVSPAQGRAVVFVDGLAEPVEDRVYQLWEVGSDQQATSAGLFRPDAAGTAQVVIDGSFADTAAIAITEEPAGGSPQPTSDPIGVAPLA